MFGMYWSWVEYDKTGALNIGEIIVKNDLIFDGSGKLVTYLAIFSVITWFCVTKIGYSRVTEYTQSSSICVICISNYIDSHCSLRIYLQFYGVGSVDYCTYNQ